MGDELNNELDEMMKAFGEDSIGNQPEEETPTTEQPEEPEEGLEETPATENVEEELEEPEEEPPVTPQPTDERDQAMEELRKRIDELEGAKQQIQEEPTKPDDLTLEEIDFIGDLDLDELTNNKSTFNKLLNSVYSKGVSDARNITSEKVLMSIPDIVRNNVSIITELNKASEDFYVNNEDLKPFKKVVALTFEEIAAKNPDKHYSELMDEVATETRKKLQLHKEVKQSEKSKKSPRLPNKGTKSGSIGEKPDTSSLESEIESMNKSIGR
jgi:hypothetical protein